MNFTTDKQTLNDLNIFGKRGQKSIYDLFNKTHTRGGARILEEMFLYPLADAEKINERGSIIAYFREHQTEFPFRGELFDTTEYYLSGTDDRTRLQPGENTLQRKLKGAIGADTEFDQIQKGVLAMIEILDLCMNFVDNIQKNGGAGSYDPELQKIRELLENPDLKPVYEEKKIKKLSFEKTADFDQLFRFKLRHLLQNILSRIYYLDVYISVARVATINDFAIVRAYSSEENILNITKMRHPYVKNAVTNTLEVNRSNNIIFLTGANMAGKSTFMKTLGVTVFLAHMGFPVPAEAMEFSVMEGMFTTINLPDNISQGYSHFYAEVLRVRKVAEQLKKTRKLLLIFDELFRGTNVKDAYDATIAVTEAFAQSPHCIFVISTHIVEAAEILGEKCNNIDFVYFPTIMKGKMPEYTYTLTRGITNDRHGMMIIDNEKILEILKRNKQ